MTVYGFGWVGLMATAKLLSDAGVDEEDVLIAALLHEYVDDAE